MNGGGKQRFIVHLTDAPRPEVIATSVGPAIYHAGDFTPVGG
jgi:hypothetical protein